MDTESERKKHYLNEWESLRWHEVAHEAIAEYDHLCDLNEDPACPQRPKRGGEPFHKIFERVVYQYYPQAVNAGFTGGIREFGDEMKKARRK